MDRLVPFLVSAHEKAYIVFLQDGTAVPKGISAYFFRDTRVFTKARIRVKAKKDQLGHPVTTLTAYKKVELMERLHNIARQYDYQFDRILDEAKRQSGMR